VVLFLNETLCVTHAFHHATREDGGVIMLATGCFAPNMSVGIEMRFASDMLPMLIVLKAQEVLASSRRW
jgi:hypothetical protein